jgi:hypothetical protein
MRIVRGDGVSAASIRIIFRSRSSGLTLSRRITNVASAAAACGMLPSIYSFSDNSSLSMVEINLTHHTSAVSVVNEGEEVAIITATTRRTRVGSNNECLWTSVLRTNGIPSGRANVSSTTTPGGCYLCFKIPDSVGLCQRAAAASTAANCIPHGARPQGWGLCRECPNNFQVQVQWPHAFSADNERCQRRHGLWNAAECLLILVHYRGQQST